MQLHKWCQEAGGDIEITYDQQRPRVEPTATDNTNLYWVAFKAATDEMYAHVYSLVEIHFIINSTISGI